MSVISECCLRLADLHKAMSTPSHRSVTTSTSDLTQGAWPAGVAMEMKGGKKGDVLRLVRICPTYFFSICTVHVQDQCTCVYIYMYIRYVHVPAGRCHLFVQQCHNFLWGCVRKVATYMYMCCAWLLITSLHTTELDADMVGLHVCD